MDQALPERFQTIFRQQYPTVLRKLIHLVGDRMVAEDLAQEVFLRLYRNPPDDLRSAGAWLHRVATRVAYDFMRKSAQQRRVEEQERVRMEPLTAEPSNDLAVIRNQDRETVKRVLQQLSERDRQVLLLRYSGYSYAEIADIIGVNPEIVGTVLRRALGRFRRQFHGQEGAERDGGTWAQGQYLI